MTDAEADVKVAQATLEKAQVMVRIRHHQSPIPALSPIARSSPANTCGRLPKAATSTPLLTVERTDKMRVVCQMPDRDVPYCNVGDTAVVEMDALPGVALEGVAARRPWCPEWPTRRTPLAELMHVEIDLENPTGQNPQGMYGHVTIIWIRAPTYSRCRRPH